MALNAYLHLKGQKQGVINGSVTQRGREGEIMVIALNHEIISPRDPQSGLPTGKRMHKPLIITKELDRSSPLLYNALCNNENITEFVLEFFGPNQQGVEKMTYNIQLVNASIADIKFTMPNNENPATAKFAPYEEVAFTYQKITWTWVEGAITASDDWETPVT